MRLEIKRLPQASSDLFDIWDYISPNSQKGATRVIRELFAAFEMLADQPMAGRKRSELGYELRSFPVMGYVVFYRHDARVLTLIRILHAARDVTPDLLTE